MGCLLARPPVLVVLLPLLYCGAAGWLVLLLPRFTMAYICERAVGCLISLPIARTRRRSSSPSFACGGLKGPGTSEGDGMRGAAADPGPPRVEGKQASKQAGRQLGKPKAGRLVLPSNRNPLKVSRVVRLWLA